MFLGWRDNFKKSFDVTYELVRDEVFDISFPCYGGRFLYSGTSFYTCYLYLNSSYLVYTYSGGYIYKIPLNEIKKLKVKKGFWRKNNYHIYFLADRKYHFIVYDLKNFSTKLTGEGKENVKTFIDTLQKSVKTE